MPSSWTLNFFFSKKCWFWPFRSYYLNIALFERFRFTVRWWSLAPSRSLVVLLMYSEFSPIPHTLPDVACRSTFTRFYIGSWLVSYIVAIKIPNWFHCSEPWFEGLGWSQYYQLKNIFARSKTINYDSKMYILHIWLDQIGIQ